MRRHTAKDIRLLVHPLQQEVFGAEVERLHASVGREAFGMRDLEDAPGLSLLAGRFGVGLEFFHIESGPFQEPWNGQVVVRGVAEEVAEM